MKNLKIQRAIGIVFTLYNSLSRFLLPKIVRNIWKCFKIEAVYCVASFWLYKLKSSLTGQGVLPLCKQATHPNRLCEAVNIHQQNNQWLFDSSVLIYQPPTELIHFSLVSYIKAEIQALPLYRTLAGTDQTCCIFLGCQASWSFLYFQLFGQ